jgi:hypothetical protein
MPFIEPHRAWWIRKAPIMPDYQYNKLRWEGIGELARWWRWAAAGGRTLVIGRAWTFRLWEGESRRAKYNRVRFKSRGRVGAPKVNRPRRPFHGDA